MATTVNLNNFEKEIEEKIVKRGLDYYLSDCIENIEFLEEDEITAEILGTEFYEVFIQFKNEKILKHYCTCPYSYGEFCKHEAAVLFYLKKNNLENIPKNEEYQFIKKEIYKVSKEDLIEFLLFNSKYDNDFREELEEHLKSL